MPVPTFGKGKAYSRTEEVKTEVSLQEFKIKLGVLVESYSHHTILSWYLTNCKVEMIRPLARRAGVLFITTDFAENVLVIRKHELSEQFFHRIEILLWGGVVSFLLPVRGQEQPQLFSSSYMISSDYRLVPTHLNSQ